MSSIFTKIVKGEIPSHKIAENDNFLAFLDITPLRKGHVLVIPKLEVDYIFDLEDHLLSDFHIFTKEIAIKIKKAFPCKKIGMTVIGLEVPHAHIHLIPMNSISDMNFLQEKLVLSHQELADIANLIINA
ncbi:MAG: HIT family protein [Flavobacteriia bacterium]|nr:HIT family protein [Flavobacteriia bacterium]